MIARPTTKRLMEIVTIKPRTVKGQYVHGLWKAEDGKAVHLVHYDSRFGWYCEIADHGGRNCPAALEVKSLNEGNR
jgi:hypothetical protein